MNWTIIVPLKALPDAKTRLLAASADLSAHADLVDAIRADTLAAAASAGRVLLVVDRAPAGTGWPFPVVTQRARGLNQALREAADFARARWPADAIAALVGDLPALRAAELGETLALAADNARAFVVDATGSGTTLLTALPGVALDPGFGAGSAARHARGAVALPAGPGLRLDVDTAADLERARELGLGPATTAARGSQVDHYRA